MGLKEQRHTSGLRKYWPVLGFLMLIAILTISWLLAPEAIALARRVVPRFSGSELPPDVMRYLFTFLLFVLLGSVSAALLALAAPRRAVQVKEADLVKEREALVKRKELERERQRKMNRAMRSK